MGRLTTSREGAIDSRETRSARRALHEIQGAGASGRCQTPILRRERDLQHTGRLGNTDGDGIAHRERDRPAAIRWVRRPRRDVAAACSEAGTQRQDGCTGILQPPRHPAGNAQDGGTQIGVELGRVMEADIIGHPFGDADAARDLRLALVEASQNKIGTVSDALLLLCYHYDPSTGKYSRSAMNFVRAGGIATMLGLASFIFLMVRGERKDTRSATTNTNETIKR